MNIFIKKILNVYFFSTEAEVNRSKPVLDERMAAVSARLGATWRKTFDAFVALQEELEKLYENTPNKS